MPLSRRFLPAFLIGFWLFVGAAQAQTSTGGTKSQPIETKTDGGNFLQPWQPCLNSDPDAIKTPLQEQRHQPLQNVIGPQIEKPNSQAKAKHTDGHTYSNRSSVKNKETIIHNTVQPGALGSSFLDGYLLNSLKDKGIGRKKDTTEKESRGDSYQGKVKRDF